jgi:S1-C subfamily serine protease
MYELMIRPTKPSRGPAGLRGRGRTRTAAGRATARVRAGVLAAVACLLPLIPARAADAPAPIAPAPILPPTPSTSPAGPAAAGGRPALERLNQECVALYAGLQGSVLRVQMPTPLWAANVALNDNRFDRYTKLNQDVRRQLAKQQLQARGGPAGGNANGLANVANGANAAPGTQPAGYGGSGANNGAGFNNGAVLNNAAAGDGAPGTGKSGGGNGSDPPAGQQAAQQAQAQQPVPQQVVQQQAESQDARARQQYTLIVPPPQGGATYDPGPQQLVVGNRGNAVGAGGGVTNLTRAAGDGFAPNQIGLLLNDQGDVLVPTYIEREAVGDQPVRLAVGDGGEPIDARFVGSDEQTQLTVLRCVPPGEKAVAGDKAGAGGKAVAGEKGDRSDVAKGKAAAGPVPGLGRPVPLSRDRLADGTLVLVLSPADGAGRLTVWNNNGAREFGVVVTIDGRVAGIARGGQFLSGSACQLIADQIVRHGAVRRATLGVIITQVDPADPARGQVPELGDRPAVRVDQVIKGSTADRAGVRVGDLILAVAGEPVHDIPSLAAAIAGRDGPTQLSVLREGAVVTVTVALVRQ